MRDIVVPEKPLDLPVQLRRRVAIERVEPDVDDGRFPVKRVVGDTIRVAADIVCDGHDELDCCLHVRHGDIGQWTVIPMTCVGNDRWEADFTVDRIGHWQFTITGRVDSFATWLRDLKKREDAGENLGLEFSTGAGFVAGAAHRASASEARELEQFANAFRSATGAADASSPRLIELMSRHADRRDETRLEPVRSVWADRSKAAFSAWYEVFPRSWGHEPGAHGTFVSLADRLDYVAGLGFDVLYMTPIHPIGVSFRKGKNNSLTATPDDVGSPWAIGSAEGGHTAIHPKLGSFADFQKLRAKAESLGMELALDLAIQCAPDHPWVKEHPEWFRHRADGSIRYAENPPKKYQDIVPIDFHCEQWRMLWEALGGVVRFWVEQGVRIFRVDNPHTKPFAFWEWLITDIHRTHPDVLFLSEAFTRPKVKYRLAKLGFTQSYTYFTWRTERDETAAYLEEVTHPPVRDFFRPNFWPNTPDILHETLQRGGRPMFMMRLGLAALSVGNWGIYGPAMELLEATPVQMGSEEYRDSEKYEIKAWNIDDPASLAPFIRRLNQIRRSEMALVRNSPAVVQSIDDPHLLAWTRYDEASKSRVLVVVNMAPGVTKSGQLALDPDSIGLAAADMVAASDLLDGGSDAWGLAGIRIECTPESPVRVFRLTPITDCSRLVARITTWLPEARWFSSKGRLPSAVTVADLVPLPDSDLTLALVTARLAETKNRYVVTVDGHNGTDAVMTAPFATWVLNAVSTQETVRSALGAFQGHRIAGPLSTSLLHSKISDPVTVASLGCDASNTSLVARQGNTSFAIKVVRRSEPGSQPEVEVGRFLTEVVGWPRTPSLRGWLTHEAVGEENATVIATVHDFVDGCSPVWDSLCETLAKDSAGTSVPNRCISVAAGLGRLTAEMHVALSSRLDVPAFAPEADDDAHRRARAAAMANRVRQVLAHAGDRAGTLAPTLASRLERLSLAWETLAAACLEVGRLPGGQRIRVHGDYHLGQVLVKPSGELFVIDFEGEPARTLEERAAKTSPFKDVAGMCRSFDYLLRFSARSAGRAYVPAELAVLEGAFLSAYQELATGHDWWPSEPAVIHQLLAAWKVDKAVYELVYEIDHRPDWVEVPLAALETIVAQER